MIVYKSVKSASTFRGVRTPFLRSALSSNIVFRKIDKEHVLTALVYPRSITSRRATHYTKVCKMTIDSAKLKTTEDATTYGLYVVASPIV